MSKTHSKPTRSIENYLKPIPADKPLGPHYKVQRAGWLMGKSTKWLNKKIEEGLIDGYLLDGDIVVSLESINAYMEMCRITGEARKSSPDEDEDD